MTVPLLVYTDAPSHNTGLARINRELCAHIHQHLGEIFRVATLGVFGRGSATYPWMQYSANGPDDAIFNLRQVTEDFFQGERGVVFSITPPSWLFPLALPQFMVKEKPEWKAYSEWAATKPFELWSYLAVESHGPFNQYGPTTQAILRALDRRLYYSQWGVDIACRTGIEEPDGTARFIHHGINTAKWQPASAEIVRKFRADLGVGPNDLLLGCVATNTRRKLLPLLFESAYLLRHQLGNTRLKLWLNTDIAIREYNITELASIFGFREGADFIMTSSNAKRQDEWLAAMYSACDLTTLPTGGEGFGYPAIESLACGTPCVTGSFGAQSEFFNGWRDAWTCPTMATHVITNATLIEPIYDPHTYAQRLLIAWTELRQRGSLLREDCATRAQLWAWPNIWPHWAKWLVEGAAQLKQKLARDTLDNTAILTDEQADKGWTHEEPTDVTNSPNPDAPTPSEGNSVGSPIRGDADEQGQCADLRDDGRLGSGAPIGVDRETHAAGA